MIGTKRVALVSTVGRWRAYRSLWDELLASPDWPLLFGTQRPQFPSLLDRAWAAVVGQKQQWRCHRFVIKMEDENIGVAEIHEDRPNAVCFLVLGLLPQFRGRKLGTVAAKIMLRHSFSVLGARRVESSVVGCNHASLRMQDGMIQEGILKERCVVGSHVYDEILFRLLKSEWEEQIMARERQAGVLEAK